MPVKRIRIGSLGPFLVDTDTLVERYDGSGTRPALTLYAEDQIAVETPPQEDDQVVRKGELDLSFQAIEVADIAAPDLAAYGGYKTGTLLLAFQVVPGPNKYTLYAWDEEHTITPSPPLLVAGLEGTWVAIGGAFVYGSEMLYEQSRLSAVWNTDHWEVGEAYEAGDENLLVYVNGILWKASRVIQTDPSNGEFTLLDYEGAPIPVDSEVEVVIRRKAGA